jgi:hypothetical protein
MICLMSELCFFIGLQLYREIKLLTREPSKSNHCISCRVIETLTETPNQSSEIFDTPAPSPAQERQAPVHNPVFQITTFI